MTAIVVIAAWFVLSFLVVAAWAAFRGLVIALVTLHARCDELHERLEQLESRDA